MDQKIEIDDEAIQSQKYLYVLALRSVDSSEFDALVDGYGRGLSTPTGPHILAWEVEPGDRVLARLEACFERGAQKTVVECPTHVRGPDGSRYGLDCRSVLGRAVSIGECDADGAFGHDALRDQIEHAARGDYRSVQCRATLERLPLGKFPDRIVVVHSLTTARDGEIVIEDLAGNGWRVDMPEQRDEEAVVAAVHATIREAFRNTSEPRQWSGTYFYFDDERNEIVGHTRVDITPKSESAE